MYSELTLKTPEPRQWRHSGVFIVNFEHFTPFFSVSIVDFEQVNASCAQINIPRFSRENFLYLVCLPVLLF